MHIESPQDRVLLDLNPKSSNNLRKSQIKREHVPTALKGREHYVSFTVIDAARAGSFELPLFFAVGRVERTSGMVIPLVAALKLVGIHHALVAGVTAGNCRGGESEAMGLVEPRVMGGVVHGAWRLDVWNVACEDGCNRIGCVRGQWLGSHSRGAHSYVW